IFGHAQIYRQGYLENGRREPSKYLIPRPRELLDMLRPIPHVQEVTTRVNFSGLANNGRADLPVVGEGVEPDKENRLSTALVHVAGHSLQNADPFGINVGEGVAHALKLKPGDLVNLTVSTPEGAVNALEFKVAGIFRT